MIGAFAVIITIITIVIVIVVVITSIVAAAVLHALAEVLVPSCAFPDLMSARCSIPGLCDPFPTTSNGTEC